MAYGEPRLTNDIDVVASIEERYVSHLIEAFPASEYYVSDEMIREAIEHQGQFNIIHPGSGLKVDVIIRRNTPFEASRFRRLRRIHPAESYEANFAAPEDVIIKKMEYYKNGGSGKHLRDIIGILKIGGDEIDFACISVWAEQLGLTGIWEAVKKRLGQTP